MPTEPALCSSVNEPKNLGRNSSLQRTKPGVPQEIVHSEPELEQTSLSIESLDQFDTGDYQQLQSTMVSQISSAVLRGSGVSEVPFLGKLRGKITLPRLTQGVFSKDDLQSSSVPPPSHFSISSVDPLHYLGITPTVQSAELLQACK
jgi:hypothetical protein